MNRDIPKKIKNIAEKYDLNLVLLFGSQAEGNTHNNSDTDVAFLAPKITDIYEQAKITTDLMNAFGTTNIDTVNLRDASPLLMKLIALKSIVLYEKRQSLFNEFFLYALRMFDESAVLFDLRRHYLDHKIKEYSHA